MSELTSGFYDSTPGGELFECGKYALQVVSDGKVKRDSSGRKFVNMHCTVINAPPEKTHIFCNMSAYWFQHILREFMRATGMMVDRKVAKILRESPTAIESLSEETLAANVLGCVFAAELGIEDDQKGNPKNVIMEIEPLIQADGLPAPQPNLVPLPPSSELGPDIPIDDDGSPSTPDGQYRL